jgi:hypothetical protein
VLVGSCGALGVAGALGAKTLGEVLPHPASTEVASTKAPAIRNSRIGSPASCGFVKAATWYTAVRLSHRPNGKGNSTNSHPS